MKRSEINTYMSKALELCERHSFLLPPFATWTPEEWKSKGTDCHGILKQQLGWDITDFGSGDFEAEGLILFTIRNGIFAEVSKDPMAKSYAEKMLIVGEKQLTPIHFHFYKTEDIINRGGGVLVIRLWNATEDEKLADTPVTVNCDGIDRHVEAGGIIELLPGESVTLPHHLYHKFWGKEGCGTILVGEVSRVCNEYTDNRFYNDVGRFAEIEEDVPPLHLLFDDYKDYYPGYEQAIS